MAYDVPKYYKARVFIFIVLIVFSVIVLNSPFYLIERADAIQRIVDPILLITGLVGSVLKNRYLRFFGWIGIVCFIPAIFYSTPSIDHDSGYIRGFPVIWRLVTTLLLFFLLVVGFKLLSFRRMAGENS